MDFWYFVVIIKVTIIRKKKNYLQLFFKATLFLKYMPVLKQASSGHQLHEVVWFLLHLIIFSSLLICIDGLVKEKVEKICKINNPDNTHSFLEFQISLTGTYYCQNNNNSYNIKKKQKKKNWSTLMKENEAPTLKTCSFVPSNWMKLNKLTLMKLIW